MLTVPDAIPGTADLEVSQTEPPLLIDLGFGKGMNADISISQMVGQTKLGGGGVRRVAWRVCHSSYGPVRGKPGI